MTRCPQERTARALVRFPVHRIVRGGALAGAALAVSPCLTTCKLWSLFLKEQEYWNSKKQNLYQPVLLWDVLIRKGL